IHALQCDYRGEVITCVLQSALNVRDHLVWQQIPIGVDWSIVIVIAVKRIVTPGRIPIARIQEIVSAGDKDNGIAMLFPPIAIVPIMPIATKSIGITKTILASLTIQLLLVVSDLTLRQITRRRVHSVIFGDALSVVVSKPFEIPCFANTPVGGSGSSFLTAR